MLGGDSDKADAGHCGCEADAERKDENETEPTESDAMERDGGEEDDGGGRTGDDPARDPDAEKLSRAHSRLWVAVAMPGANCVVMVMVAATATATVTVRVIVLVVVAVRAIMVAGAARRGRRGVATAGR